MTEFGIVYKNYRGDWEEMDGEFTTRREAWEEIRHLYTKDDWKMATLCVIDLATQEILEND